MTLRNLPPVDEVVRHLDHGLPHHLAVRSARAALDTLRTELLSVRPSEAPTRAELLAQATRLAEHLAAQGRCPSLRRVLNATGVPLHTNLGRAPLAEAARRAMADAAGPANLELSLADGSRISRQDHIRDLVREATGAEDGLVVNNNAAAVWLVLRRVRRVVVSRGELVEIGDSFRLPDIMAAAGVELTEVGTTNRTTAGDYRRALDGLSRAAVGGPNPSATGGEGFPVVAVALVHPSNYRVMGYTARPERREVVRLAHEAGALVIEDLGSGALFDMSAWGLGGEPTPRQAAADGVDVVTFSGDKLLGGPQCGIIAGRARLVADCRRDPVNRCLRPDKTTLAALEATLRLYRDAGWDTPPSDLPVMRALTEPVAVVRARARKALRMLRRRLGERGNALGQVDLVPTQTEAGGGSLPGRSLESWALRVAGGPGSPDELWSRLAAGEPPVVSRRHDGAVLLDLRAIADDELPEFVRAVVGALGLQPANP